MFKILAEKILICFIGSVVFALIVSFFTGISFFIVFGFTIFAVIFGLFTS